MHGSDDELFDLGLIVRVTRGDRDRQRRILGDFLRVNEADLALVQDAVRTDEHEKVQRLAHRIKGAALTLGAHDLVEACRALDEASRATPSRTLDAEMKELLRQAARLAEAIAQRM